MGPPPLTGMWLAALGHERVVLELRRGEDPDLVGPEGRDVEGRSVAGHGHALRQREGSGVLGVRDRRAAAVVVDVLVQVPRGDAAPGREHGDPALVQVPAQAVPCEDPGALEPIDVVRVGVGDIDLPVHGIDDHRVQDGADALEEAARSWELVRRVGHGVEHEHVLVGQ